MKQQSIFILILLSSISCHVWSLDANVKKKYPHALLTNDYDILNENDLAAYRSSVAFSVKEGADYNYWQCFPRDHVLMTLEDKGYSSEDIGWKENYGDLKITVWIDQNTSHEYFMRRPWPVNGYEQRFNRWQKLMKNERYVCLAGRFDRREEIIQNGIKQQIYSWTFDRIKTKKGCDSYFVHQCDRVY